MAKADVDNIIADGSSAFPEILADPSLSTSWWGRRGASTVELVSDHLTRGAAGPSWPSARKGAARGSERSVERQHAKGKMLARERIDYLLDPDFRSTSSTCCSLAIVRHERPEQAPLH